MKSVGENLVRGSLWNVGLRWATRLTGLASTIILARLLTPEDFGVVAIAMIFVGAVEVLSETGQKLAIIRHPEPGRDFLDSAWTVSVLFGIAIATIIFLLAPLAVEFFHEPRAADVIRVLALRPLIGGFENIGMVLFRRELNFRRDFQFMVAQKIIAAVSTVTVAYWWHSYWALVLGVLVARAAGNGLSYLMHPFRPQFSFSRTREIWSFSVWIWLKSIGTFINTKVDEIAAGVVFGAPAMGRYSVSSDVASAPTQEIAAPVAAAVFPVLASVSSDNRQLAASYSEVLHTITVVCAPLSVGVALVARDFVTVLLGGQWVDGWPLVVWLALTGGVLAVGNTAYAIFDVRGMPRVSAQYQWIRVVVLIFATALAATTMNVVALAIARFVVTAAMAPLLILNAASGLGMSTLSIVKRLSLPVLSTGIMAMCVLLAQQFDFVDLPFARLLLHTTVGALVFVSVHLFLWNVTGRPDGVEARLWDGASRLAASIGAWGYPKRDHS